MEAPPENSSRALLLFQTTNGRCKAMLLFWAIKNCIGFARHYFVIIIKRLATGSPANFCR